MFPYDKNSKQISKLKKTGLIVSKYEQVYF